jgi:glycerophosphoryl diester phosphodiesterase
MPQISAHRGGPDGTLNEGSLDAYRRAVDGGVDFIELDIRSTRDGVLVCSHDPVVDGIGEISALGFESLLRASDNLIPTVREIFQLAAGRTGCHIDIKGAGLEEKVVTMATEILGTDKFFVTSLEDDSVSFIRSRFPGVNVALTIGRDMENASLMRTAVVRVSEIFPFRRLKRSRANGVAANYKLVTRPLLWFARKNELRVVVWTVDDERRLRRFLNTPGVDVVVTNNPALAMKLKREADLREWP